MADSENRVAVDIGGTFTDLVAINNGELEKTKTPTTPENFANGVLNSLDKSKLDPSTVSQFVHGTTVVINAITEREGVRCGLITTEGFRDVLDITRANRPDMFNFRYQKPEPFVPRQDRWEVQERIDQDGTVLEELSEDAIREIISEIEDRDIKSVAVSFINSYANPRHEKRVQEIFAEETDNVLVTLSHDLTREYREYERTNTAVLNGYVRPIADQYLSTLDNRLNRSGLTDTKYAMKSNTGMSSFESAKQRPVEMVESGPVGGVYGASELGKRIGERNVISFDMGGTTAKTSLIEDGDVSIETDYWIESSSNEEGYPLKIPVVDIIEIGAGGGSIGWIDQGGSLKVGPKSAGAEPGPACYDQGGTEPTVTDANLITGRLNPDYFLGGEMPLSVDRARESLEQIADHFDTSIREAALGMIRVVNSNMSNALKQVSIQRGHDPRDFVMVAAGGAGGLHASTLGRELGVNKIVIPRAPGQFSAWGMLMTDVRKDFIRTNVGEFSTETIDEINKSYNDMETEAISAFSDENIGPSEVYVERSADLRYEGQEHTVNTPISDNTDVSLDNDNSLSEAELDETINSFHRLHKQNYNFELDDPIEVVNLRLIASHPVRKPSIETVDRNTSIQAALKNQREIIFEDQGSVNADVYERDLIPIDHQIEGPAVVEEAACTVLVHPDQHLRVDEIGNLIVQKQ